MQKYHLAIDAIGNDLGYQPWVEAIEAFKEANPNFAFTIVADVEKIKPLFKNFDNLNFINNPEKATLDNVSLRQAQKQSSSMRTTFELLKDKKVDAILSAGDTAILLAHSTFILERLTGVDRPAFMPVFPTINQGQKFLMLDVGANLEVKPSYIYQWAKLAFIFSKNVLGVKTPRLNILNIGTEDYKGFAWHREASQLIEADQNLAPFYKGFLEPRELMNGVTDIVIADGYAGNMVLKSYEGAVKSFGQLIKREITASFMKKMGALILKGAFKNAKNVLDHRNVGGAYVIGVDGLVVKAHGNSDKTAFLGALGQIKNALEKNIIMQFKNAIKE
ncbi:phosphate acyltransferase PlsX [Mycoplasmopsis agassizii]|uniref:phosphate acyltransferase PlsX n=1 Tax=Mycoplasmopsis agassizii TaxID=33922 RepID=UPI0035283765